MSQNPVSGQLQTIRELIGSVNTRAFLSTYLVRLLTSPLARNDFRIARDLTGTELSVDTNGNRVELVHGRSGLSRFLT